MERSGGRRRGEAVEDALKAGEQDDRRDDVRFKARGSRMRAPQPVEHSMPEESTEQTASAVPSKVSWHGLAVRTGRGQMQSASQQANPDVSVRSMFARSGPQIPNRSPPYSTVETFENLHLRVTVFFATCTHVKLYLLQDTRTEKKSVRSNTSRILVTIVAPACYWSPG